MQTRLFKSALSLCKFDLRKYFFDLAFDLFTTDKFVELCHSLAFVVFVRAYFSCIFDTDKRCVFCAVRQSNLLFVHKLFDNLFDGVKPVKFTVAFFLGNALEKALPCGNGHFQTVILQIAPCYFFGLHIIERRNGQHSYAHQIVERRRNSAQHVLVDKRHSERKYKLVACLLHVFEEFFKVLRVRFVNPLADVYAKQFHKLGIAVFKHVVHNAQIFCRLARQIEFYFHDG